MQPSISVVTPSYQQGRYIERTIQSVLEQGIPDLEYVVFDGGSTDQTVEILKKYQDKLRWVSRKDRGQSDAVNKGISTTTGSIIGWLNSDDIYYPAALRTVLDFFASHDDVDVLYGDARHIRDNDEVIDNYYTEQWNFARLMEVCYLCQPAVFFRRRVVNNFGALDDRLHFCMDYELWLRWAQKGAKFHYLQGQFLAGSRLHQSTKTLSQRPKVHREINQMMIRMFRRVPDQWIFNYAHCVVDDRGIPRDHGLHFAFAVGLESILAALKYNKRISWRIFTTAYNWTLGSAVIKLRSRFSR